MKKQLSCCLYIILYFLFCTCVLWNLTIADIPDTGQFLRPKKASTNPLLNFLIADSNSGDFSLGTERSSPKSQLDYAGEKYLPVTGLRKTAFLSPFVPYATFLYPLKISENLAVFWCFQGVEKGCIENKWVKQMYFRVLENFSSRFLSVLPNTF